MSFATEHNENNTRADILNPFLNWGNWFWIIVGDGDFFSLFHLLTDRMYALGFFFFFNVFEFLNKF